MGVISDTFSLAYESLASAIQTVHGIFEHTFGISDFTISLILTILVLYSPLVIVTNNLFTSAYSSMKIIVFETAMITFLVTVSGDTKTSDETMFKLTAILLLLFFVVGTIKRIAYEPIIEGVMRRDD